jgi:hypothetical protein
VSPYFTLANAELVLNTTADDGPHTITVIKLLLNLYIISIHDWDLDWIKWRSVKLCTIN